MKKGRKPIVSNKKCESKSISLTAEEWAWLEGIDPDGKPTRAAARLIRKAMKGSAADFTHSVADYC